MTPTVCENNLAKHVDENIGDVEDKSEDVYCVAMTTDSFKCGTLALLHKIEYSKLLELRVFNESHEIKAVRGSIGKDFQVRDSKDYNEVESQEAAKSEKPKKPAAEPAAYGVQFERHYLDRDEKRSGQNHKDEGEQGFLYRATGGGSYYLPENDFERVKIENFYKEDKETGILYPFDYRIVGFLRKGEE